MYNAVHTAFVRLIRQAAWLGVLCTASLFAAGNNALTPVTFHSAGGAHIFQVESAADETTRQRGLMYRETLAPNGGMIFYFEPPRVATMWMKNTRISLDMIFVNSRARIVYIAGSATPGSLQYISAGVPVSAVIEIPGGSCDRLDIRVGDQVDYERIISGSSEPQ